MRIAQLAPIYERVPPVAYGGTELIVHLVTEELVRRGHDVTLFASADSRTAAELRSVTPEPLRYGTPGPVPHPEYLQLANAQACFRAARSSEFDLVHNHAGIEGMVLAETSHTPVLTTSHQPYEPVTAPVWEAYPWYHNEISTASAATFPASGRLAPIHHGIDLKSYPLNDRPQGYLVFLGRFSRTKGPNVAIEVARRSGQRLLLAGKVDAKDQEWFARELEPAIDGTLIRFVGEVAGEDKRRLLADASALLFPISWDEPFGLVMIEAMACGTPVIGFRQGSVPEVIDEGTTGLVVDDLEGMVRALRDLPSIQRRACREQVERRFSLGRMVDDYEAHYRAILSGTPTLWAGAGQEAATNPSSDEASFAPPRVRW